MHDHERRRCTVASSEPNRGREFVLFGQSAKATNDASFRGYIALDIRDFTTTDGSGNLIHEQNEPGFFNQVDVTTSINILKDTEANWIRTGYPGPDLCAVTAGNFLPCAQLAVLNGSSSGIFVEEYEDRYQIGDKLLLQLYDGTVKTVPDFNIQSGTLTLPTTGTGSSTVQYTFSPQFAISGATVTTTIIPDDGTMTDRWWRHRVGEPVPQRLRRAELARLLREPDPAESVHLHAELEHDHDDRLRQGDLPGLAARDVERPVHQPRP